MNQSMKVVRRWPWVLACILVCVAIPLAAIPLLAVTDSPADLEPRSGSNAMASATGEGLTRTDVTVTAAGAVEAPQRFAAYRGEVRARRESSLSIRRGGQLLEVLVNEGDRVRKGDRLAGLDTADLTVRERLADADVDTASALATEAVAGPRYQTLKASAARVRQLKAQLGSAQSRFDRQERLSNRNSGSAQELDDTRFAVEELQSRLDAAIAELEELNEGTRTEQVEAAKARRRAAIAAREQVDVDRSDSEIVAPYDGVIANRYLDEGEMVSAGQPILRILETDPIEAHFGVPADVASDWRVGDSMSVVIGTLEVPARVVRMQPQVDPVTRTRGIDMQIDPSGGVAERGPAIMVGQTALLQVPFARHHLAGSTSGLRDQVDEAFWLPTESLVRGSRGLWSIYVAVPDDAAELDPLQNGLTKVSVDGDPAMIERREVRVVQTSGTLTLVEGMIRRGEWVVTDGAHRIGPRVPVRIYEHGKRGVVELPSDALDWKSTDVVPQGPAKAKRVES